MGGLCHRVNDFAHLDEALMGMDLGIDDLLLLDLAAGLETLYPFFMFMPCNSGCQFPEDRLGIPHDAHVHRDDLSDFAGVYVDVDYLRLLRIGGDGPGHPVVESHSYSHEHITFVGLDVRSYAAVHSYHSHEKRIVRSQGAQA